MTGRAPQILVTERTDGAALRVTFVWTGDRFSHAIAIERDGRLFPILASADCCDTADWPAAPPLQQLSIEPRADQSQVALLVGMAGKHHWSASVETVAGKSELAFDLAVRTSVIPEFAGSSYRAMLAPIIVSPTQLRIDSPAGRVEIRVPETTASRLVLTTDGLAVHNTESPPRFPATVRWQYRVALATAE